MPFDSDAPVEVTARDRLIRLRDFIAKLPPEKFDMHHWECGTAACIGGWAERLFNAGEVNFDERATGELIGLSEGDAYSLFYPWTENESVDAFRATPAQAAKVLDHLLATGEVNWDVAFK